MKPPAASTFLGDLFIDPDADLPLFSKSKKKTPINLTKEQSQLELQSEQKHSDPQI